VALIDCPECGKGFSDQAKACPNCGRPSFRWITHSASQLNHISFAFAALAVLLWLLGFREFAGIVMLVALALYVYYLLRRSGKA
jgi:hypothetical protein